MFYYDSLNKIHVVGNRDYFDSKVGNDLFYALHNEFGIYHYVQPKKGLSIRNYVFYTYPMRVLYYSVCLYMLKISEDYIKNISKYSTINAYYGGDLKYSGREKLTLNSKSVYYKEHYNLFRSSLVSNIEKSNANSICVKLDIREYFDSIDVNLLLELLTNKLKPSLKSEHKFDEFTKEHLKQFFSYIRSNNKGIPQMDNGITSDFLGHLYMTFADSIIDDILKNQQKRISEYKIYRYVDDVYLIMELSDGVSDDLKDNFIEQLGGQIANELNKNLLLNCNTKSGYFRLDRGTEKKELLDTIKKVSPDEPVPDEVDSRTPRERADSLIEELKVLKNSELGTDFEYSLKDKHRRSIARESLNEVFSKNVDSILNSQQYKTQIEQVFEDFDFNLIRAHPKALLTIMCRQGQINVVHKYKQYLLSLKEITYKEVDLILHFLSQHEFDDRHQDLKTKLSNDENMKIIMNVFNKSSLSPNKTGYFKITKGKIKKLRNMPTVIAQIKMRVVAEKNNSYREALNHLLNEVHGLCFELDSKSNTSISSIKNYRSDDVVKFLRSKSLPNDHINHIRNLFDRRNINPISHPGSEAHLTIDVTKEDYVGYKKIVGKCIDCLLSS